MITLFLITSLFYTSQELHEISSETMENAQESAKTYLCFEGILFRHEQDWTLWLGGEKIESQQPTPYPIVSVSEQSLCLRQGKEVKCLSPGKCLSILP